MEGGAALRHLGSFFVFAWDEHGVVVFFLLFSGSLDMQLDALDGDRRDRMGREASVRCARSRIVGALAHREARASPFADGSAGEGSR